MNKNYALLLTSVILTAFNAQAEQIESGASARQGYQYEDARFENKTFRLYQPLIDRCIRLDSVYNPTSIEAGLCTTNSDIWSQERFQYIDGNIKTIQSGNYSVNWGGQKCLTSGVAPHNEVYFTECNGSDAQQFRILKPFTDIGEDRFLISNRHGSCLFNSETASDTKMTNCKSTTVDPDTFVFELVDVTDPVHVRLVNRGWYNMSFSASLNGHEWNPPWQALDGIRELVLPTLATSGNTPTLLRISTDFNALSTFDVEPGDYYEATAHGTVFGKSMKAKKVRSTPQLKIYPEYNYHSGYDGPRYISDNIPNLMLFNNSIKSFEIPSGWTVRFFEEKNYQGRYYTRNVSSPHDSHVDMNIKSIKILSK